MIKRQQIIWDSAQIHTALAAATTANFFQAGNGASAAQLTTGTNTPYTKTDYHTNNVLNGVTELGQELEIYGIDIHTDLTDLHMLKQLIIDTRAIFQFKIGTENVFQAPLHKLFELKVATITGFTDAQATAKAQKFSFGMKGIADYLKLDKVSLVVPAQTTFKPSIVFSTATTFKSYDFDYNTLAANAANTSPFNLFVSLHAIETRS